MTRIQSFLAAALAAAFVICSAPRGADAAEAYAILASGQKIQGDVPAGQAIRLEFPLPAGTEPRITLTLLGGVTTISFVETHLFGPDGKEIALDEAGKFFTQSHPKKGVDTIGFKGWTATQSGNHQLYIRTNARVVTHAQGKVVVARALKVPFRGDETSTSEVNPVVVALQPNDGVVVVVNRIHGTAPKVAQYQRPDATVIVPGQKTSKKGATTYVIPSYQFGDYAFTIGYQTTPAAGAWKGFVKITPFKGGGPATLRLRNAPGVPLSVFDVDRFVNPVFASKGIGVASDGNAVAITSENNGVLYGGLFDADLAPLVSNPNTITLTSSLDFTAGETLSGHRFMAVGGVYYLAFSTTSGQGLSIVRLGGGLQRFNFQQVVNASTDSTHDFFMTGDGVNVSLGVFNPSTNGHTVYLLDEATISVNSTVAIGGGTRPQSPGAGAAWRGATDAVFELWTPDTLDYRGPSALHRVLYDAAWAPTTPDARLVDDPTVTSTMPTAVTIDAATGVTIVHYVVADNPAVGPFGTGQIHRRLFDASGVEIPGSHVTLPRNSCNRPAAAIWNKFLYLGYDTPTGPIVERYPLLRTTP